MESSIDRGRLRAPSQDGGVLVEPDVNRIDVPIGDTERYSAAEVPTNYDDCLRKITQEARREVLEAALAYTRSYRHVDPTNLGGPVFVGGHQPELFHPGVWAKNFALADLADRFQGVAINLVIDSDAVKSTAVAVPRFDGKSAEQRRIPFDSPRETIPHEFRDVADETTFQNFGAMVSDAIRRHVRDPLISALWPLANRRGAATHNLGLRLAQSRHQLEGEWGVQTLELPQSQVGSTRAFSRFALHLFKHATEFRETHNHALWDYRRDYGVRSRSHPVPELESIEGWTEVPFWIYSREHPRRARLFVQVRGTRVALSDRQHFETELPDCSRCDEAAVDALLEVGKKLAIRSRALATTLFARLFLADVFVHGIGGAKYDRLTDEIIRRYFRVDPRPYMVVTATMRLPIAHSGVGPHDLARTDERLRELTFHPEVQLDGNLSTENRRWVDRKWEWIRTEPRPDNARRRCQEIRQANAMLQPALLSMREKLESERREVAGLLQIDRVLSSREYSFCLHSVDRLREMRNSIRQAIAIPLE